MFDNLEASRLTAGVADAPALAEKVSDAWLAFARSGDPNTPELPPWPRFEPRAGRRWCSTGTSAVANDPLREQRLALFEAMDLTT